MLAREIGQAPKVLLVGQPTRGVDIGAIEFIHAQLRALRDAGCALLVVSSELDEILALADRVLVMNEGRITGELPIAECTEAKIGLLMVETRADRRRQRRGRGRVMQRCRAATLGRRGPAAGRQPAASRSLVAALVVALHRAEARAK